MLSSTTGQAQPGLERLRPARRAHAPLVAVAQAGEPVLRHRRRQVVADCLRELEEVVGDPAAHDVHARVVAVVLAATGAVVAGDRVERARLQLGAEHVDLPHGSHPRTAGSVGHMLEPAIRDLAASARTSPRSSVRLPNGQIATHVMWVDADDEHVLINTEIHRAKFKAHARPTRTSRSRSGSSTTRTPTPRCAASSPTRCAGPRRATTSTRSRSSTRARRTRSQIDERARDRQDHARPPESPQRVSDVAMRCAAGRRRDGFGQRLADDDARRSRCSTSSACRTRRGWCRPTACPTRCSPTPRAAAGRGLRAIIAGAGGAAHLPGMLSAKTIVPVLGVPVASRHLSGHDSLLSIVQMPAGVPTATFAIGEAGATNAALFAVAMLRRRRRRAGGRRCSATATSAASRRPRRRSRRHDADRARRHVGMLGGGQLGRYALMAARTMGYRTAVLDPDPHAPAKAVADLRFDAEFDDERGARRVGRGRPTSSRSSSRTRRRRRSSSSRAARACAPSPAAVAIAQDRIREKRFLVDSGLPGRAVRRGRRTPTPIPTITYPAILKTARLGYDGKGQRTVDRRLGDARRVAAAGFGAVRARAGAGARDRGQRGRAPARPAATSPPSRSPRTRTSTASSTSRSCRPRCRARLADRAVGLAMAIADALDYVGVLAVEMFVVDGDLVVNELAPRPHNSGHWTLDVAQTSQFAQQVRAVCGLGLGDTSMTRPAAAMVNLLGDLWSPASPTGSRCSSCPTWRSTSTASRRRARAARWATSRRGRAARTEAVDARAAGAGAAQSRLTPTSSPIRYVTVHATSTINTWRATDAGIERSANLPTSPPTTAAASEADRERRPRRRPPRRRRTTGSAAGTRRTGSTPARHRRRRLGDGSSSGSMPNSSRACTTSATSGWLHHLGRRRRARSGPMPWLLVHRRQLGRLLLGVEAQLAALDVELALDQVVLGRHRHPLAGGHRDPAGHGAGQPGQPHHADGDARAGEPEQQRDVRHEPVAGTEHRRPRQAAPDRSDDPCGADRGRSPRRR